MGVLLSVFLLTTGCEKKENKVAKEETFHLEMTDAVNKIKERGYLNIGVKDDVPGFGYYNKKVKSYEGGEIELAYYIAAKILDVSVEEAKEKKLVHFTTVTVSTREKVLIEDKVDYVIATYTITEKRKEKLEFSKPYYRDAIGLMVKKDPGDDKSLRDTSMSISKLDGKKVGVIKGATTRKDFLSYINRNQIHIAPMFMVYQSYDALDDALEKGNIDVFCVDTSILKGYMKSDREILSQHFAPQNYGAASLKSKKGLADVVNVVLDELDYKGITLF